MLSYSSLKGQETINKALEYLQKYSIQENDWENTAVILEDFMDKPLIINDLNYQRIQIFPLLNSRHFFVVKKYKQLNGTIFTANELINLPFFTPELLNILSPFISFEEKKRSIN